MDPSMEAERSCIVGLVGFHGGGRVKDDDGQKQWTFRSSTSMVNCREVCLSSEVARTLYQFLINTEITRRTGAISIKNNISVTGFCDPVSSITAHHVKRFRGLHWSIHGGLRRRLYALYILPTARRGSSAQLGGRRGSFCHGRLRYDSVQ